MTIKELWVQISVKGDFERIKARFTDNIREERIPITDVTIKKEYVKLLVWKGCGLSLKIMFPTSSWWTYGVIKFGGIQIDT